MAAWRIDNFTLTGQAESARLRGAMASARLFAVLGMRPVLRRTSTDADDRRGAPPVAIVTSNVWTSQFAGDPGVLGRRIRLNGQTHTVVGVMPSDDVVLRGVTVIVPAGQWSEPLLWDRGVAMGLQVVGRLKPDVTPIQAQSELDALAARLARDHPRENRNRGIVSVPLGADVVGDVRTPLLVLQAAVGFVLLIACANVAHLLLVRSRRLRARHSRQTTRSAGASTSV